jgi:DNA-binding transcriptional LysR family regulator
MNALDHDTGVEVLDLQTNAEFLARPSHQRDALAQLQDYSRASHPSEMLSLIREGFGVALVREGTPLDDQLTTRPIVGIEWTVDTALVYHKLRCPKTVPVLVRKFKRQFSKGLPNVIDIETAAIAASQNKITDHKEKDSARAEAPVQLRLLS